MVRLLNEYITFTQVKILSSDTTKKPRVFTEEQLKAKRAYSKKHYQENKEAKQKSEKLYRSLNPEKSKLRSKKYWENNKYKCEMARINKVFGLSQEQYETLLKMQQGLCYICNIQLLKMNIDHCHKTGKVRKLLCTDCNVGLGFFKDNPEVIHKALLYIKEHNGRILDE